MGEVYLAHDARLARDVALKVLAPGLLEDSGARKRFRREAEALSRVNHPNIATIHDFETFDGHDVLVMEHVAGRTLDERLREGPLDEHEIAKAGAQLAQGLTAAHASGVIHRDLKPRNVRLTPDGRLKILDFGLARMAHPAGVSEGTTTSDATVAGVLVGTVPYMAPEQLRGQAADERTDVYGAGMVLFEMATGRRPFSGSNVVSLAEQVLHTPLPSVRALNPHISPDLERIVVKALQRRPEDRYQTARDLAVDLRHIGAAGGTESRAGPRRVARLMILPLALVSSIGAISFWAFRPLASIEAFKARDWVLVADVRDADGRHGGLVREALTVALQQSRYVNVVPRERVIAALRRMERAPDTPIDEATSLDLSRRENVPVVLAGHVDDGRDTLRVTIRALRSDGTLLFAERVAASGDDGLIPALDDLAARVRRALGESGEQVARSRPLASVTTRSTAALERYSASVEQLALGNIGEAEAALNGALALDPDFAMAHVQLAHVALRKGTPTAERAHLESAYALRDRLTDRERYEIEGAHHLWREEYSRAEDSLRTLVGLHPDDARARTALGEVIAYNGRPEDALVQVAEAVRLDPTSIATHARLVMLLAQVNRNDEALRQYDEALRHGTATPDLRWGRAMALFGADRLDLARAEFARMSESVDEATRAIGRLFLARLDVYEGRVRNARRVLEREVRADREGGRGYPERVKRYLLGRIALIEGRTADARREALALLSGGDLRVQHLHNAGHLLTLAGDTAGAERALARLTEIVRERPNAFARSSALQLEGEIAAARGRESASDLFRQADAAYPSYHAHVGLAEIAERRRDWATARDEWREVLAQRGDILRNGFTGDWLLACRNLARVEARLGEVAAARAHYARIVTAWQDGDDTAARREVTGELQRLDKGVSNGAQ
jgi:Tfp pilus assembly protein PilF